MKLEKCKKCKHFTWKFYYHNEKDGYCKEEHYWTDFIVNCEKFKEKE